MTLRNYAAVAMAMAGLAAMSAAADPQDAPKSTTWAPLDTAEIQKIERNAREGDLAAIFDLASLYEQGAVGDGKVNFDDAFKLYEKAAGRADLRSRERLCLAYLTGEGRPADIAKAMGYCNKLPDDDAVALFSAGYDYDHGISGPKDEKTAVAFYAQAVKKGSGDAMGAVGAKALAAGNPAGARKWFRQGVVNGSGDAMAHLAALLDSGQGGAADPDEARWLYANAGRRGNSVANAWLDSHGDDKALPHVNLTTANTSLISEVTKNADGTTIDKPFNVWALGKDLTKYFPARAMADQVTGTVIVQCYIDGNHQLDVCLSKFEYPVGYDYGPIILALFNGQLKAADTDTQGAPTAHATATFVFRWLLN